MTTEANQCKVLSNFGESKTISIFKLRPSSQLFQITNIKLHGSLSALRFQDVNSSPGSHTIEREIHGETITKYYSWKLDQKTREKKLSLA